MTENVSNCQYCNYKKVVAGTVTTGTKLKRCCWTWAASVSLLYFKVGGSLTLWWSAYGVKSSRSFLKEMHGLCTATQLKLPQICLKNRLIEKLGEVFLQFLNTFVLFSSEVFLGLDWKNAFIAVKSSWLNCSVVEQNKVWTGSYPTDNKVVFYHWTFLVALWTTLRCLSLQAVVWKMSAQPCDRSIEVTTLGWNC